MTQQQLTPGEYILPQNCTLVRKGSTVNVYEKKNNRIGVSEHRCKDCVHYVTGHNSLRGWTTTVCNLRPKRLRDSMERKKAEHPVYKDYTLYYHAKPYDYICDKFKLNDKDNEQNF